MRMPTVIAATVVAPPVQIQTTAVTDTVVGGTAQVGFLLEASGPPYNERVRSGGPGYTTVGPWVLIGVPTDYEVRYSGTGDTPSGAPINTWLDFSLSRQWELVSTLALEQFTGTIELRRASNMQVLLSQSLVLTADGSP